MVVEGGWGNCRTAPPRVVVEWMEEGDWIGRCKDSSLESLVSRRNGGGLVGRAGGGLSALLMAVQRAAAMAAGATEKRRPIWTVALLSVLS